jgi:hypothetical protein
MNEILEHNDIIHIYDNKNKYLFLDQYKYIYFVDYDNDNTNFININSFVNEKDEKDIFTNELIAKKGQLCENVFNNFVYNKIKNENYKIIIYDFKCLKSVYFIRDMFLNTRINKIKTILCFSYNLPPDYRENIDVLLK